MPVVQTLAKIQHNHLMYKMCVRQSLWLLRIGLQLQSLQHSPGLLFVHEYTLVWEKVL